MEWERARTEEQKELRIAEIVAATERLYDKYDFDEILSFTRDEGFEGIEMWRNWRGGYPDPGDDLAVNNRF